MRLGELLELQWGDINWRGSCVEVRHAFVGGVVTTPKNHQRRRVELSRQLRAELLLWRRRERAAWLKRGRPAPPWLFASVSGTRLDPSNVRKAFNRILDAADLHRRGPHQMRHTFASLPASAVSWDTRMRRSPCGCTRTGFRTRRGNGSSIGSMRRNHPQPRRNRRLDQRNGKLR